MIWDWLVAATIILALIIAIWARVSNQTVLELLSGLKDILFDRGEQVTENAQELVYYE